MTPTSGPIFGTRPTSVIAFRVNNRFPVPSRFGVLAQAHCPSYGSPGIDGERIRGQVAR